MTSVPSLELTGPPLSDRVHDPLQQERVVQFRPGLSTFPSRKAKVFKVEKSVTIEIHGAIVGKKKNGRQNHGDGKARNAHLVPPG
jgi:hypothetical protein